ncbi:MAG: transglycosylase SLT domain-containing protein [Bacteroidia bacterium]|nr:transglycosylase SLT domain-containing protein [Bacteroidia bacterium]
MKHLLLSLLLLLMIGAVISCSSNSDRKIPIETKVDSTSSKLLLVEEQEEHSFDQFNAYDSLFQELEKVNKVDWLWLKAIMIKESHGEAGFISSAGAVGLMQLMPRKGSYIDDNFRNYQSARKQRRKKDGLRYYQGKSETFWVNNYRRSLDSLQQNLNQFELYQIDKRFEPKWNITDASRQFSSDFYFFRSRKHGLYKSRILAFAAYNAGRYAVMTNKNLASTDHIPINRQTESYVANVERILKELKDANGLLNERNYWILKL